MKRPFFTRKLQNLLILYAAVAPLMASPLYLLGYLGWGLGGGIGSASLKSLVLFWSVPAVSILLLVAVLLLGTVTPRTLLGIAIAAALNSVEFFFAAKITSSG